MVIYSGFTHQNGGFPLKIAIYSGFNHKNGGFPLKIAIEIVDLTIKMVDLSIVMWKFTRGYVSLLV